jgi:hypothetical protein
MSANGLDKRVARIEQTRGVEKRIFFVQITGDQSEEEAFREAGIPDEANDRLIFIMRLAPKAVDG